MDLSAVNKIYFLGIGGIGMSALARYFMWMGKEVYGYDRISTPLTVQLQKEGAKINFIDEVTNIPAGIDLVIYTPAIPATSKQLQYVRQSGLPIYKRAQILGMITQGKKVIAVAGTHGKTTVTTILAHIFNTAGAEFMAFLGGISTNYINNFIRNGNPDWVIVEADEYDRSFLQLFPDIAIITSMDADHLDIYGNLGHLEESFSLFAENVKQDGMLVTHQHISRLKHTGRRRVRYSLNEPTDYYASGVKVDNGRYSCNYHLMNQQVPVSFGWAGRHNLENALAATTAAINAGIPAQAVQEALSTFRGVKRRFEIILQKPDVVYIDDYAHHPEEIKTCLKSAFEMFPGKRIAGIFQPHLYSRTRDFAAEFAQSLSMLHRIAVMDIYPARELPIEGVTANLILDNIENPRKLLLSDDHVLDFVSEGDYDVLITMGAGDIDTYVDAIKNQLER